MGLIKGNKIRYTDSQAIIGDDVITPPTVVVGLEASSVVPAAPTAPEDGSAQEEWDLGLGDDLGDLFAEPEEQGPTADAVLEDYDAIREHLLQSANDAAEREAGPLVAQAQGAAGGYLEKQTNVAHAELMAANPEADFEQVAPYVQRHAVAQLELELAGTVSEVRWTHLKRIEEKLTSEAEQVAAELEERHPPESFAELLARREEILSAARLEAERLVMEAQTRAAAVMAEAEGIQSNTLSEMEAEKQRILEALSAQAREAGYEEGKAAGEAEAATYVQEALQKLNEIAIAFPAAVKQNEEKLVSLALEIAAKVIQTEISLQPEIVQRTVETALRRVSDLEQVTIKVNPLDLDLILPKQETFKSIIPDVQSFSIEGSHTIQRGGCVIETNSGSINATINAQLSIVEEIFKNIRAEYEDEVLGELS